VGGLPAHLRSFLFWVFLDPRPSPGAMFPVIPAGLLVSRLQRIGGDDWEPPALRGACIGLAAAQGGSGKLTMGVTMVIVWA
jgi:hypothetical protein